MELRDPPNHNSVANEAKTEPEKWRVANAARLSLTAESLAEAV